MIDHDEKGDVLYVKSSDEPIEHSRALDGDDFVIVNYDRDDKPVGLILLGTEDLTRELWQEHYEKDVPKHLYRQVYDWLPRTKKPGEFEFEVGLAYYLFFVSCFLFWATFPLFGPSRFPSTHTVMTAILFLSSMRLILNWWRNRNET